MLSNDRFKIMQFTGLLDKNGTKIFEGDIIKGESGLVYEVVWGLVKHTLSGYPKELSKLEMVGWCAKKDGMMDALDDSINEVIGNVFSNPEMIKP